MKVRDLLQQLQHLDPEMEIILQKDAEGNGFSPLAGIDSECIYVQEDQWESTVYDTRWTAEEANMEEDEWQELIKIPKSLILYPTN